MISIIIIVKNDRGIENTLKKLIEIPKPEKTEILVIDASEGNLDDIKKKFPKVRWINFYNRTIKKYTYPEQRNIGIKKAKGDIVVFIDANCIPNKNWLIELFKTIKKEGEDMAMGSVKSIGGETVWDVEEKRMSHKKYLHEASTINLAFRKDIIKKVGFFDESFEAGEDVDFTWRVVDSGYKIKRVPGAIVSHDWGNLGAEMKRSFRYGEAQTKLYKKHFKTRWKNFLSYNRDLYTVFAFCFFLYILFLPLTFFWPYYLLFIIIPIIKNIRRRPFEKILIDWSFGLGIWKGLVFPIKDKK